MNFRAFIPNFFTSMNLLCGCFGIYLACTENLVYASYCVGLAAIFDYLDGTAARLLSGGSELGKQLDSLADCVTFGVLPGIMLFQFISIGFQEYFTPVMERPYLHLFLELIGFSVSIFSALRLAKFNLDLRQSDSFIGLPTPANAILIASIPLLMEIQFDLNMYAPISREVENYLISMHRYYDYEIFIIGLLYNPYFFISLSVVMSALLVIELPLFALKFKNLSWRRNKIRFLFIGFSALMISTVYYTELYFLVIPIIIAVYLAISILYYWIKGKDNKRITLIKKDKNLNRL